MFMSDHCGVTVHPGWRVCLLLCATAVLASGCDKAPLLAPTQSTITISAPTDILASGASTEITAHVIEQAGTAVQNGTTVRFTTTLGTVEPENARTRNGVARTVFSAGSSSGIAEIRATSGAATGGDNLNLVRIAVGAAAVGSVTLRANPGSVGPSGGSVELIALAVSENGQGVDGVVVTFAADQGSLSSTTATTDRNGEARVTLMTSQETMVTATAGTRVSPAVTVPVRAGPIVSLACAPAAGAGTCAALQADVISNTAAVLLTVTKATGSSALRSATIDFGDGQSLSLGNLAGGSTAVAHAYAGPSEAAPTTYTATLRVEDINGETASTSASVTVAPRSALGVSLTATGDTALSTGQRWTFTATAIGVPNPGAIQSYTWAFGDGAGVTTSGGTTAHVYTADGTFTVTVTMETIDGRTSTATTEILIALP
jgi:hypothetical protein